MADLKKIVYLTETQKEELFTNNSVTVNGVTVTFNADDLYVTPNGGSAPVVDGSGMHRKIWATDAETIPNGATAGDIVLVQTSAINNETVEMSGSNSNGSYVRFTDGTQICWKRVTLGTVACTTAWGALYESGYFQLGDWPIAFIDVPVAPYVRVAAYNSYTCIPELHKDVTATSAGQACFWRANSQTCPGVVVEVMAIGRWK